MLKGTLEMYPKIYCIDLHCIENILIFICPWFYVLYSILSSCISNICHAFHHSHNNSITANEIEKQCACTYIVTFPPFSHIEILSRWLDNQNPNGTLWEHNNVGYRSDSKFAPSQWDTVLLCNYVFHWLGASLESRKLSSVCNIHVSGPTYLSLKKVLESYPIWQHTTTLFPVRGLGQYAPYCNLVVNITSVSLNTDKVGQLSSTILSWDTVS